MNLIKPVTTEKAVKLIELENTLMFEVIATAKKPEIKEELERMFKVKVERVNVLVRGNTKYAYIKLKKENPAIDVATKLGLI